MALLLFIAVGLSEMGLQEFSRVPLLVASIAFEDMHLGAVHAECLDSWECHVTDGADRLKGLGGVFEETRGDRAGSGAA